VRQQLLDAVHVGLVNLHLAAQLPLTLAGPFAVLRKRFAAARLVFNLGMIDSSFFGPAHKHARRQPFGLRAIMPLQAG
jgi:hypothetical protein